MSKIIFQSLKKFSGDVRIIFVTENQIKEKKNFCKKALGAEWTALLKVKKFSASMGEQFPVIAQEHLCLYVGLGKLDKITPGSLRQAVRQAILSQYLKKANVVDIVPHDPTEETVTGIIEGILIGGYQWKKYLTKEKETKTIFCIHAQKKSVYEDIVKICEGVNFARDMVNDNAQIINSHYIEQATRKLIKGKSKISLKILNTRELKQKGLDLFLAVNQASQWPAKLIIVDYRGLSKSKEYTAIVGKGVTFDTGGLNLKPSGYIETMRTDMSGAAAVLGVLKNTIDLKIKKNILFVAAIAENAVGSTAYKPGDVIKSYSGKTVEIGNTDAEGRLILADTLSYLVKNYQPKRIIDIATLTGACVVALGPDHCGLMSNSDTLAQQILDSAKKTDDRVWRLPLYDELKEHLKSQCADLKNIGLPKGSAGALSAAEFLHQFVEKTPWAHLDIAGTAFIEGAGYRYFGHGATGIPVRLLTNFLKAKA